MQRQILLLFSLSCLAYPYDFYSAGMQAGIGSLADSRDFNMGHELAGSFYAYTEYFFMGAHFGEHSYLLEDPYLSESMMFVPLTLIIGNSGSISSSRLDFVRYRLGCGPGVVKGFLSRLTGPLKKESEYSRSNFYFVFDGSLAFNLYSGFYLGPYASYRFTGFTFKDPPFTGEGYSGKYKGSGFNVGIVLDYYWGLY